MEIRRLFDLFDFQLATRRKKVALAYKDGLNWENYSTEDCLSQINQVSAGLIDLGLKRGDKVAVMVNVGSPRWLFLDFGMQQIGAVGVPISPHLAPQDLIHILNESQAKYCIVSNRELLERVEEVREDCLQLKGIFMMKKLPDVPGWDRLTTHPTAKHMEAIQGFRAAVHEDDLVSIVYSFHDGVPRGVLLSHKNLINAIRTFSEAFPLRSGKKAFSYLPPHFLPERLLNYVYLTQGLSLYFAEGSTLVLKNLREVRPNFFTVLPPFLEHLHHQILDHALTRSTRKASRVARAIRHGQRYNGPRQMPIGFWLKQLWYDLLVYRRWRKQLGGRIEGIWMLGPHQHTKLARLYSAAGIPVREGFGLVETAAIFSSNAFDARSLYFGTAGPLMTGIDVQIDAPAVNETGELYIDAPTTMIGYLGEKPVNGWFRTGWLGKIKGGRFLEIRGRKKDRFQLASGMTVLPQLAEQQLLCSPYIQQCIVFGENRPHTGALLVPFFPLVIVWCWEHDIAINDEDALITHPEVLSLMAQEVANMNQYLNRSYQIGVFRLLPKAWSTEGGEYTADYILDRPRILKKYAEEIEAMYNDVVLEPAGEK